MPLTSDSPCKCDVSWHERDSVGVDGAQVGILEEVRHESFRCLLDSQKPMALEADLLIMAACHLSDDPLEGVLGQDQLRALLQLLDLSEDYSAWPSSESPLRLRFLRRLSDHLHRLCSRLGRSRVCSEGLEDGRRKRLTEVALCCGRVTGGKVVGCDLLCLGSLLVSRHWQKVLTGFGKGL